MALCLGIPGLDNTEKIPTVLKSFSCLDPAVFIDIKVKGMLKFQHM